METGVVRALLGLLTLTLPYDGATKQPDPVPCDSAGHAQFDFWLGDWDVHWTYSNGRSGVGKNQVVREFAGCVVTERYQDITTGFSGTSLLGYNTKNGMWTQTWLDNQGDTFTAVGKRTGGKITLDLHRPEGVGPLLRVVFEDFTPNSLTWRFQGRATTGAAWSDFMVSRYRRIPGSTLRGPKP